MGYIYGTVAKEEAGATEANVPRTTHSHSFTRKQLTIRRYHLHYYPCASITQAPHKNRTSQAQVMYTHVLLCFRPQFLVCTFAYSPLYTPPYAPHQYCCWAITNANMHAWSSHACIHTFCTDTPAGSSIYCVSGPLRQLSVLPPTIMQAQRSWLCTGVAVLDSGRATFLVHPTLQASVTI